MKRFTFIVLCCAAFTNAAYSQTTITDSINLQAGYPLTVYYSLKNGAVKTIDNNMWQLAFGVDVMDVSVRTNAATGSSGDGSVITYECPSDTNAWGNFDTTGYATSWEVLNNSDETWEEGALNQNISSQFDYGWGIYNSTTHIIVGHRLYLIAFKSGGTTYFKKLFVLDKNFGVWHIKVANVDGSDEQTLEIKATDYPTETYAYISFMNAGHLATVLPNLLAEPANDTWDFMMTRYAAFQAGQGSYYPSTGILTNYGVRTAEVRGVDDATSSLSDTIETSDVISVIGADWKVFDNSTFSYRIVDSLSYFVQAQDGAFWKLVFTEFVSSRGHAAFGKTKLTWATGISDVQANALKASVYPNPASTEVTVLVDAKYNTTNVTITDLTGKVVMQKDFTGTSFQARSLDLQELQRGMYFITITNGSDRAVQKLLLN